jgi:hypothetical protein
VRQARSPITQTLETWPLAGEYRMRWGRDPEGGMWVAVESADGKCEGVLPYQTYLDMERSRSDWWKLLRG